jgi:FkbM family methyltransferase
MSWIIRQPGQAFKNIHLMARLGADGRSRRQLAKNMLQANLKRLHHGWSCLANRAMGTRPANVHLRFESGVMPFHYRPGTTDLLVLEQIFLHREYNLDLISSETVEYIVDLGSNIGVTAMLWADRFPNARMALVEPDPDNFGLLQLNTAGFAHRCQLINAAVSNDRGRATFFRSDREYGHSMLPTDDCVSKIEVRTLTVPDVLKEANFPRVDLLKMDIEGGETVIMPTLASWQTVPRYLVAELHPPYDFAAFAQHCRSGGLRARQTEGLGSHLPFASLESA